MSLPVDTVMYMTTAHNAPFSATRTALVCSRGFWTGVASCLDLSGTILLKNQPEEITARQRYLREVGLGQSISFVLFSMTMALAFTMLVALNWGYFILVPNALIIVAIFAAIFAHRIPATVVPGIRR